MKNFKQIIYDAICLYEWGKVLKLHPTIFFKKRIAVVVPADPLTLTGSKGDEAMLRAIYQHLKIECGYDVVCVHTATKKASEAAIDLGFQPHQYWMRGYGLMSSIKSIEKLSPDKLVVMGADMMDAHYSLPHTVRCLGLAHYFSRAGVKTVITGFSFNEKPDGRIKKVFNRMPKNVFLNIRDPISYGRFKEFTSAAGRLTADVAFLQKPHYGGEHKRVNEWCFAQRKSNKKIIGVNIHPMLFIGMKEKSFSEFLDVFHEAVNKSLDRDKYSLLMIPHDNRGAVGDVEALSMFAKKMEKNGYSVEMSSCDIGSNEIKSIAALPDAIVTGRMHLAIAALGGGVPVLGLAYQGKFLGLMKHFGLDGNHVIDANNLHDVVFIRNKLEYFVANLDDCCKLINNKLPVVKNLAAKNFDE